MSSQFADLYEKDMQDFQAGSLVKGKIVAIHGRDVLIDISYKAEGVLHIDEFTDPSAVQIGAEMEFLFEAFDDEQGVVILSKKKADRQRTWSQLLSSAEEGRIVEGKICRKVRGGFMVDIGMEAFLPASLVDLKPTRNLDQFLGITSKFMIVKINHKRKNIVVSRKDYLEKEKIAARSKKLQSLTLGQIVKGRVKNITDFGAFIDLGDLDGLLHITDMSWGRISHPSEIVKLGDEVDVVVIGIDREGEKVSLGLKQKSMNPWDNVEKKYPVGLQTQGRVVNILPYGAFVELEAGIEGLVHISELSWTKRVSHPSELLAIGDVVDVVVLNLDKEGKKISLGMKQVQENPWTRVNDKYPVGTRIHGTVRNLTDYGVFVEIEPGVDGLVHISDLSWTHKVNRPSDLLKKGDTVEVMVLAVDAEAKKVSLGIKQLTEDPWDELTKDFVAGLQISGKVTRIVNFGLFVELENGLEGLVHISEIPGVNAPVDLEKNFRIGEPIHVSILHIDHDARKIALTLKGETASTLDSR
ncbi:MAG: 30S ribosomal protein S1 [Candidatus Omnitrophica bacterium]|nr:30S ribosomal protein S1 [Candidatus Omnitrophota bacterium]